MTNAEIDHCYSIIKMLGKENYVVNRIKIEYSENDDPGTGFYILIKGKEKDTPKDRERIGKLLKDYAYNIRFVK